MVALGGGVVFDKKRYKNLFFDFIESGRKEKATESDFGLFTLRPCPEAFLSRTPHVMDCNLAPVGTVKVSAGNEAAVMLVVEARVSHTYFPWID